MFSDSYTLEPSQLAVSNLEILPTAAFQDLALTLEAPAPAPEQEEATSEDSTQPSIHSVDPCISRMEESVEVREVVATLAQKVQS